MAQLLNLLKTFSCSVNGHQMQVSNVINDRITEKCCSRCGKQITTTIYGEVVPLNDHYARINRSLRQLSVKKGKLKNSVA